MAPTPVSSRSSWPRRRGQPAGHIRLPAGRPRRPTAPTGPWPDLVRPLLASPAALSGCSPLLSVRPFLVPAKEPGQTAVVGVTGVEPAAFRSQSGCATKRRYTPALPGSGPFSLVGPSEARPPWAGRNVAGNEVDRQVEVVPSEARPPWAGRKRGWQRS